MTYTTLQTLLNQLLVLLLYKLDTYTDTLTHIHWHTYTYTYTYIHTRVVNDTQSQSFETVSNAKIKVSKQYQMLN